MGDNGEHEHAEHTEVPAVPVVTPVVHEAKNELVEPVIDHTEKITRIEEQQARHQEDMFRQLRELEERLSTASNSQVNGLMERIATLEGKIEASTPIPDESVELAIPDVESTPEAPENVRQGLRHRRKKKRAS